MNILLFVACVTIWGSTWIAITFQVGEVDPAVAVAWRFSIATLCLGFYMLITGRSFKMPSSEHFRAMLAGLLLYTLDYSFLYAAQQYIVSALLAVLSSSIIYLTVFFRWGLLRKPLRVEVLVGATLGLLGIVLIFLPEFQNLSVQQGLSIGLAFAAVSFICAALGNILSESILERGISVLQMNFYAMGYSLIFLYGFGFFSGASYTLPESTDFYLALGYLAIFGSVFAFGAYMKLLQRIGSDKSTYVVLIYPIIALALSTVYEGYLWTVSAACGVVIVLMGNAVAMGKMNWLFRHFSSPRSQHNEQS